MADTRRRSICSFRNCSIFLLWKRCLPLPTLTCVLSALYSHMLENRWEQKAKWGDCNVVGVVFVCFRICCIQTKKTRHSQRVQRAGKGGLFELPFPASFFCWRLLGLVPGGAPFSQLSSGVRDAMVVSTKLVKCHFVTKTCIKADWNNTQKGVKQETIHRKYQDCKRGLRWCQKDNPYAGENATA